jgi:hypothetical protein
MLRVFSLESSIYCSWGAATMVMTVAAHVVFTILILFQNGVYQYPGLHVYVGCIGFLGVLTSGGGLLYYLVPVALANSRAKIDAALMDSEAVRLAVLATTFSCLTVNEPLVNSGDGKHPASYSGQFVADLQSNLALVRNQIMNDDELLPETLAGALSPAITFLFNPSQLSRCAS